MLFSKKPWIFVIILVSGGLTVTGEAFAADPKVLHLLNRLSFGPRPGDIERVTQLGGQKYIREQLYPNKINESRPLTTQLASLHTLQLTTLELIEAVNAPRKNMGLSVQERSKRYKAAAQTTMEQAIQARLLRAIGSNQQLQEVMVDFWFNHFNVFYGKGMDRFLVGTYEEQAIRPHALGRFRDLLGATAQHPAMLYYLDNWRNSVPSANDKDAKKPKQAQGLNENYARELMELHTLGVNGGYTQNDVNALAKILTGWTFRESKQPGVSPNGFYFNERTHDFSNKVFLGQSIKGSGLAEGEQALDILARSPATARHISYKLAQYFVADQPPKPLVDRLAQKFLASDGNIREVLSVLLNSPEFNDPKYYGAKFKTPYQYVISAVRATGQPVSYGGHLSGILQQLDMPLYGCPSPDGYKNTQEAWLNPDAMTRRINFATVLAMGKLPLRASEGEIAESQGSMGNPMQMSLLGSGLVQRSKAQLGVVVDSEQLAVTLGNAFSAKTQQAIASSAPQLRSALMLGSPDFMQR